MGVCSFKQSVSYSEQPDAPFVLWQRKWKRQNDDNNVWQRDYNDPKSHKSEKDKSGISAIYNKSASFVDCVKNVSPEMITFVHER
jgi:hypothetical protein